MTLSQVARINAISGALKCVVGSVVPNDLPSQYNPVVALLAKYLAVLLMVLFLSTATTCHERLDESTAFYSFL